MLASQVLSIMSLEVGNMFLVGPVAAVFCILSGMGLMVMMEKKAAETQGWVVNMFKKLVVGACLTCDPVIWVLVPDSDTVTKGVTFAKTFVILGIFWHSVRSRAQRETHLAISF